MKSEVYSPLGRAEWPRDFDFRVEVAEQQELLQLQGATRLMSVNNTDEQKASMVSSE